MKNYYFKAEIEFVSKLFFVLIIAFAVTSIVSPMISAAGFVYAFDFLMEFNIPFLLLGIVGKALLQTAKLLNVQSKEDSKVGTACILIIVSFLLISIGLFGTVVFGCWTANMILCG